MCVGTQNGDIYILSLIWICAELRLWSGFCSVLLGLTFSLGRSVARWCQMRMSQGTPMAPSRGSAPWVPPHCLQRVHIRITVRQLEGVSDGQRRGIWGGEDVCTSHTLLSSLLGTSKGHSSPEPAITLPCPRRDFQCRSRLGWRALEWHWSCLAFHPLLPCRHYVEWISGFLVLPHQPPGSIQLDNPGAWAWVTVRSPWEAPSSCCSHLCHGPQANSLRTEEAMGRRSRTFRICLFLGKNGKEEQVSKDHSSISSQARPS